MSAPHEAEALRAAALAVSSAGGDSVFGELVQVLARILGIDSALICIFADGDRSRMRTLAAWTDGRLLDNFEYELARTPCASVIGREFRYVGHGAAPEFAAGTRFHKLGIDSYCAYSLSAPDGEQLGLIVAMNRKPLPEASLVEPLLKIFAVRAVAEIERIRELGERKAAHEALAASEAQYRAIFNASADALTLWDSSLRRVDVNPAYERIYGWPREQVIGRAFEGRGLPQGYAERRLELVQRSLAGETCRIEIEAIRKNGERFMAETTTIPVTHRGEPHVLAITRDVTARKTEEELLRASEAQYRAIFNAAADALVLRDAQFRIVDVNAAYETLSGYTREEVLGVDRVIANPREVEAKLRALHARALAGEAVTLETEFLGKDGRRRELELRGVPIRHRGAPHVLYIGRDISERKAVEQRLRQAQKMEAIGHLAGGIAHDFNNLLASIMGYVVLAAEREAALSDPKLGAHLEQALASCRRARDLIQQMLTFSRGRRAAPRPLPLGPVVEAAVRLLRGSLPATLEIRTELGEAPLASLDRVQLEQVLMNLLINARDATAGPGRVDIAVGPMTLPAKATCASCRQRFKGRFVELAVADTGGGIAPEVFERMFEPFFSTKEGGKGTGMGLATVHGIVHEHGGHLLVETAPGRGSRFRVLFPVAQGGPAATATLPPAAARARLALRGRVLVVDDEASVGEFMRELLESWGVSAHTVADPVRVPELVARDPAAFDLVIVDQTMPRMTGLRLARELLALRTDLPILLYSGLTDGIAEADIAAAGIRGVLHKPVEPDVLYGLLKAHLH